MSTSVWAGAWVADALGVELVTTHAPLGVQLPDLVGLAVRRNPARAHLLVSRVLGKHVPTDPRLVRGAALALGALVARRIGEAAEDAGQDVREDAGDADLGALGLALRAGLDGDPADLCALALAAARAAVPQPSVVLGYAETATALGHCVAEAVAARTYLHSTRRQVATATRAAGFEEEHSHATSHLVVPAEAGVLAGGPLVLVDDELSTGTTALNTIEALHRTHPRDHYVVAALVDLRADADRARARALADRLGVRLDVVALASGLVRVPADAPARAAELVAAGAPAPVPAPPPAPASAPASIRVPARRVQLAWPVDLPDGGRHGVGAGDRRRLEDLLPGMVTALDDALDDVLGSTSSTATSSTATSSSGAGPGGVLVLGTEELMHAPLRLAQGLAETAARRGGRVRFSSTTRSPVLAVDDPGCAIRTVLAFAAHDEPAPAVRFAHNVAPAAGEAPPDAVVVVVDDAGDTPALHAEDGLLAQLAACCQHVLLVVLPSWRPLPPVLRGPAFGSYAAGEVGWLLTDLSGLALEAPTQEREEAVQSGGAHYAESLPVEHQPDAAYAQLFTRALESSAARLAHAVGVVTELVLAERGHDVVLASLARAGTPVGVLVRRWAAWAHGLDLPHVAVSIVRGRGLDRTAVRWLAATTDPSRVVFVDGWTGKGAITRELAAALARADADLGLAPGTGFDPTLAVLADPGSCTPVFGTREDFLIPSACLGSTVSGLVSRTVDNDRVLAPGAFHGAKCYRELAADDVSAAFVDAVSARFADAAAAVARDWPVLAAGERTPTWAGWAAVEEIAAAHGIGSVNLVKPGVGETTRVLLRRVPWRVLARTGAGADLDHVRLLAEQRGVPVEEVDDLPYSCVGLIHPRFTRGATGDDGRSASP